MACLNAEKHNRTFEITIAAASSPLFETKPSKFVFDGKHVEVLEKATGYYKGDYVLLQRRLTGYITKLSRPKDETSRTITIDSVLGDIERKVQVSCLVTTTTSRYWHTTRTKWSEWTVMCRSRASLRSC